MKFPILKSSARASLALGAVLLSQGGCTRPSLSVAETDVVATIQAEGRDYSDYKTYILPTSVVDLCPTDASGSGNGGSTSLGLGGAGGFSGIDPELCESADHSLDDALLDALRDNMDALGYVEIADPKKEKPDVALFAGIVARDNWFVESVPGYCYPYYYYYYGCWYGQSYAYNLPTNAYVVQMADVSESEDGQLSSIWTALMQGLAQKSSEKTGKERVRDAVNQAFKQSTYLAEGGK